MKIDAIGSRVSRLAWTVFASVVLGLAGCRVVDETAQLPIKAVSAVMPGKKSAQPDPGALQVELQRFADEFSSRAAAAIDDFAREAGTRGARLQALEWKLSIGTAAVTIASGPNPSANLLDFLTLATVLRTAVEGHWLKSLEGVALQSWLDVSRDLETNAWKLASGVLEPEQQRELRESIDQWLALHSGGRITGFARPQEFSSLIRQTAERRDRPGSVFGLVGLDPTAGLDPAVREVTRTRLLAERAMFTAQRMPLLLRWQIELLADQFLGGPEIGAALTNAARLAESTDRLSRAAESASQTAALLPDRITAEREAVLSALEAQEGKLRELSAEFGRTLAAGERMSTALNTTLITFDALMKRFGVGEPATGAAPDTNSAPFNILDYARTAEQLAVTAKELDVLIKDAGRTVDSPALNQLTGQAKADAKSVLNHAFVLTAGLVLLTLACALAYRRFVPRAANAPSRATGLTGTDKE